MNSEPEKPWEELTEDERNAERLAAFDRHIASVEAGDGKSVLVTFMANDFVWDEVRDDLMREIPAVVVRVLREHRERIKAR